MHILLHKSKMKLHQHLCPDIEKNYSFILSTFMINKALLRLRDLTVVDQGYERLDGKEYSSYNKQVSTILFS